MPKKSVSTLEALARHEEQQQIARETGETLRRAAALDLGLIVLDAGGSILGEDGLRHAVEAAVSARHLQIASGQSSEAQESGRG